MKKIVFSFDDGLIDFYRVIFPILKKYNIRATLNVATGLVDKTFNDGFEYCNPHQIKEMHDYGIEMALHSDSHSSSPNSKDFEISLKKLSAWIGRENIFGVVIPYNIPPTSEIYNWMRTNKIKYLRGDSYKNDFSKIYKLLFRYHILNKKTEYVKRHSKIYKNNGVYYVPSIPIFLDKNEEYYEDIINLSPKNGSIVLMFHSICYTFDECSKTAYPRGAWTVERFTHLIEWLLKNDCLIACQKDIVI